MSAFREAVQRVVRAVPHGRVVSYGGVAALVGAPRAARAVGSALCALPENADVPWWRVVNRNGEISIRCMAHGPRVQRALLRAEGVRFDRDGRIAWNRFGWDGAGFTGEDVLADPDAAPAPLRASRRTLRSVALAIRDPDRPGLLLQVRRPPDDPVLPGVWGLPAASLRPRESWNRAAHRAASGKLSVSIRLGPLIRTGTAERSAARLAMRLYGARILRGAPEVPGSDTTVTQYTHLRWAPLAHLRAGARRGSLCCRLALEAGPADP